MAISKLPEIMMSKVYGSSRTFADGQFGSSTRTTRDVGQNLENLRFGESSRVGEEALDRLAGAE
jgi:hypothetical protein